MKIATEIRKIEQAPTPEQFTGNVLVDLKSLWPIIAIALGIIKIFTGKKADEKIDKVLAFGKQYL